MIIQALKDRQIVLNRGDSLEIPIFINQGVDLFNPIKYTLQNDDTLYVGIMEASQNFEHATIRKKYTKENLTSSCELFLTINPLDTYKLLPGLYYYEIKLVIKDSNSIEHVYTVVPKTKFILL